MSYDYFNPYRDKQLEPPVSHCAHCQAEIYRNDRCYLVGCQVICSDCLEDFEQETRSSMTGDELDEYRRKKYGGLDDVD